MQKHETPAFSLPTFPFSVQNLEPYVIWQTWDDSRKFRWPWLDVPVVELAVCFRHCAQRRNETWSLASGRQHHLLQAAPVAFQHVSCWGIMTHAARHAMAWVWESLAVLFLNSTIPNLSVSVSQRYTNTNPSCKQISWIFVQCVINRRSMMPGIPGIPSPGIVLAWLTVPWASARNSRSAHRTKRPKYFCPAADGTSARLSASMASKKSWASRSLLPWIPLQWIIDRKIPKRCGQSGFLSLLLVVGQREFEEGGV